MERLFFADCSSCCKRSALGLWNEPDSVLYIKSESDPCTRRTGEIGIAAVLFDRAVLYAHVDRAGHLRGSFTGSYDRFARFVQELWSYALASTCDPCLYLGLQFNSI